MSGMRACAARAAEGQRQFHPRTMKSLRKTLPLAFSLILAAPTAILEAQSPKQQAAPAVTSPQSTTSPQSEAQTKIIKNVNYVVLPVTVKDGARRLVPDLRKDDFRVLDE